MKFLCLLFALLVVLLSVKPCCAGDDCYAEKSAVHNGSKSAAADNDCQGCSPFFSCGSCAGFTLTAGTGFTISEWPALVNIHTCVYRQPFIQPVTLSIWQPPRLG